MPPVAVAITGFPFQSASATVEPEAFAQRLLDHDRGRALERVGRREASR